MTNTPTIRDINGNELDSTWIHEFCGFYWGEGCLRAAYRKNGRWGYAFLVCSQIGLRSDDLGLLEDFQSKLGGNISIDKKSVARWVVADCESCIRLANVLDQSIMSASKRRQLKYWKECLDIKRNRPPNGYTYPDEAKERIKSLVEILRQLKKG